MDIKIIKVTEKGQLSLPTKIREEMGIKKGDELMLTRSENSLIIKKIKKEDFSDLLKNSEKIAKKLWDNKEDEVWNEL